MRITEMGEISGCVGEFRYLETQNQYSVYPEEMH